MGEKNKWSTEKQELPKILIATSWTARLHKQCTTNVFWLCGIPNYLFFPPPLHRLLNYHKIQISKISVVCMFICHPNFSCIQTLLRRMVSQKTLCSLDHKVMVLSFDVHTQVFTGLTHSFISVLNKNNHYCSC